MQFKTWHVVAAVVLLPTLGVGVSLLNSPAIKGAALLDKATNTDKMLANYEWFHESAQAFNSRVNQIKAHKQLIAAEDDKAEKRRLNIELSAMQQTCRDLSARYAAKSNQIHVGYLKGRDLPTSLNLEQCQ